MWRFDHVDVIVAAGLLSLFVSRRRALAKAMGILLLSSLAYHFTGDSKQRLAAIEALDKPPISPTASRYRSAPLASSWPPRRCSSSPLLSHMLAPARLLSEVFGWSRYRVLRGVLPSAAFAMPL